MSLGDAVSVGQVVYTSTKALRKLYKSKATKERTYPLYSEVLFTSFAEGLRVPVFTGHIGIFRARPWAVKQVKGEAPGHPLFLAKASGTQVASWIRLLAQIGALGHNEGYDASRVFVGYERLNGQIDPCEASLYQRANMLPEQDAIPIINGILAMIMRPPEIQALLTVYADGEPAKFGTVYVWQLGNSASLSIDFRSNPPAGRFDGELKATQEQMDELALRLVGAIVAPGKLLTALWKYHSDKEGIFRKKFFTGQTSMSPNPKKQANIALRILQHALVVWPPFNRFTAVKLQEIFEDFTRMLALVYSDIVSVGKSTSEWLKLQENIVAEGWLEQTLSKGFGSDYIRTVFSTIVHDFDANVGDIEAEMVREMCSRFEATEVITLPDKMVVRIPAIALG